jgi:hypothetical protein
MIRVLLAFEACFILNSPLENVILFLKAAGKLFSQKRGPRERGGGGFKSDLVLELGEVI